MPKHLFLISTRPDIIKMAPIIEEIDGYVLHAGQHKDLADKALGVFNIKPNESLRLMRPGQDVIDFISRCAPILRDRINKANPEYVWVHGDTMTALCGALAGFMAGKKIVHVEAGLRSGDPKNPFPEEMIRTQIDHISSVHFCPTAKDANNLSKEGINSGHIVGNTIVDALNKIKKQIPKHKPTKEPFILATIHRREALGAPMIEIFEALKEISKDIKVIFPCHPNPAIRKLADKVGLDYIEPVDYITLLWYMKYAELVVTDSGGIQEEAPSFGKYVVVCRKTTERDNPNSVLAGFNKDNIIKEIKKGLDIKIRPPYENPFGVGDTAKRIKQII